NIHTGSACLTLSCLHFPFPKHSRMPAPPHSLTAQHTGITQLSSFTRACLPFLIVMQVLFVSLIHTNDRFNFFDSLSLTHTHTLSLSLSLSCLLHSTEHRHTLL